MVKIEKPDDADFSRTFKDQFFLSAPPTACGLGAVNGQEPIPRRIAGAASDDYPERKRGFEVPLTFPNWKRKRTLFEPPSATQELSESD